MLVKRKPMEGNGLQTVLVLDPFVQHIEAVKNGQARFRTYSRTSKRT